MSFYQAFFQVHFEEESDFLAHYHSYICKGRVFASTMDMQPVGTQVRVHLELPGTGMILELDGTVERCVEPESGRSPGLLIALSELHERSRNDLEMCVAFLQHQSGRVLLVDDDFAFARLIRQILEEQDLGVLHLMTPIPALSLVRTGRFDLVITDIIMPRMDGLEFADAVREIPGAEGIPILFCSGAELDETEWAAAMRLGNAVTRKPVNVEKFARLCTRLITDYREHVESSAPVQGVIVQEEPLDEQTTQLVRLADIAEKHLKKLGVRTRRTDNRAQVLGELLFQEVTLRTPFGGTDVMPRAGLVSVGHDRVRCYSPIPLAALPTLPILDLADRSALEATIKNNFDRHEASCLAAQRWLQGFGIATRLDPEHFRVLGQIRVGEEKMVFSMTQPGIATVVEVNNRHIGDKLSLDERRVKLEKPKTPLELQMQLDTVMRRVLQRLRAPA